MITCAVIFLPEFYLKKTSEKRKKSVISLQNLAENENHLAGGALLFSLDAKSRQKNQSLWLRARI